MSADPAVRISVPEEWAEVVGAILGEVLGPFQEWGDMAGAAGADATAKEAEAVGAGVGAAARHHLLFYPFRFGAGYVADDDILAVLPTDGGLRTRVVIERVLVPGGWEEGWKDHFKPLTVGRLYVRPPWESEPDPGLLDIVLTPGLAFGTGLHPTTRGVLGLLQALPAAGPVVDAGTGSGILSIGAAKLGFGPVRAFDNDPLAVEAARTNCAANGAVVEVSHHDVTSAPAAWFDGATVLANITMAPVLALLARLVADGLRPPRMLVAGILSGEQEVAVVRAARDAGWRPASRIYETEWVCMDLRRAGSVSPDGAGGNTAVAAPPAAGV
jgi:ribosomal protein L11 methyltransferase